MKQAQSAKRVASLLETQQELEGVDEMLRNHELPVVDRPKAVLALWDLFDKLQEGAAIPVRANKK